MNKIIAIFISLALLIAGCSTYTTPRYAINADTNVTLKALGESKIGVGPFTGPTNFEPACRAAGPLAPPDGMSHTAYVKKAFEDELKVAGIYAADTPRITISGTINKLEFSSARALTGGSWDIDLSLSSSNGKTMRTAEHYEFESGYSATTACKQTAEAYLPAVQDLIGKTVRAPEFKTLLK